MDSLFSPILLSFKVSVLATIITGIFGVAAAWFMARFRFTGKNFIETLMGLPLVLPPTVIGFCLLYLFGKNGPLGYVLQRFDIQIIFTWWAAIIAASVVSFPLIYRSARAGFEGVENKFESAARTLGASEGRIFFTITLPLAWPGILAGLLLAFARALGEFGATLMLAGNIPGQTQTIPLAIYFTAESGDMESAGFLVIIIALISFVITYSLNSWSDRKVRSKVGLRC